MEEIKKNSARVLLVDDSTVLRNELCFALNQEENMEVIGECCDGIQVSSFLESNEVDVILMDVMMKVMDGIKATALLKTQYPNIKVIAFTSHMEETFKEEMFLAGASAFISKGTDLKKIKEIIIELANKETDRTT